MWCFHEGMGWWWVFGGMWMLVFWAIMIGLLRQSLLWGYRLLSPQSAHQFATTIRLATMIPTMQVSK